MSENYAKVKSKSQWASDDNAGSLLADILDDTEDLAQKEQQRIEAELRAKREEKERLAAQEEQAKRLEAEARISAEHDRQEQLKERRTQRMEALRIEDLKERGEWVEPVKEEPKEEVAEQPVAHMHAPTPEAAPQPIAVQALPQAKKEEKSKLIPFAILGVVMFMVLGAVGIIATMLSQGYEADPANYATVQLTPEESKAVVALQGFTPLPKEEPKVVVAAKQDEKKTRRKRRRGGVKKKTKQRSRGRKASKGKEKFKLDLGDGDLFGGK